MSTILQDITEVIIEQTGLPVSLWRDDDLSPFNDLDNPCLLIRNNPGVADKDIAHQAVDVWFFSKANGTLSDQIQTLSDCQWLEDFFQKQYRFGRVYDVQIIGSTGAPIKDGQGRWAVPLNIQVRRSTVVPE